ncbi:MAG: hypothetical protein HY343_13210, partial [Lentisphaerae bacterium]|nr:hypothetical protein [Lentisphaerota bacterium]
GVKPLYYAVRGQQLFFASELKALLKVPGLAGDVNLKALKYYLDCLYIPAPDTIYAGIRKLKPGEWLTWRRGEIRTGLFWNPLDVPLRPDPGKAGALAELDGLLETIVREQKVADVPLGLFLSGGLDSSAIAAYLARGGTLPEAFCADYGPDYPAFNELDKAKRVARHFGYTLNELHIEPDVESDLPDLVEMLDEPLADSSILPTFWVCRAARQSVKVALTGIGGDELFGGYPRYLGANRLASYRRLPPGLRQLLAGLAASIPEQISSRNVGSWLRRFLQGGVKPLSVAYSEWAGHLSSDDKADLFSPALAAAGDTPSEVREILDGLPSRDALSATFLGDLLTYLPGDLLTLADRASMRCGLELRVPLCDRRLVEFMLGLPSHYRVSGWTLKALLKDLLAPQLPREILAQKKKGFMIPIGHWFNHELRGFMEASAAGIVRRGLIRKEGLDRLIAEHAAGRQNRTDVLWALVFLDHWFERYRPDFSLEGNGLLPSHGLPEADVPSAAHPKRCRVGTTKMNVGHPEKILVVAVAGIGDFIAAAPSLKGLRTRFPKSRIVLLVSSRAYPYAAGCPWVNTILPFPVSGRWSGSHGLAYARLIGRLRRERFDLAINFYEIGGWIGSVKMALLFTLIRGQFNVGRDTEGRGFFFDLKIREGKADPKSQGDYYEDVLNALDGRVDRQDKSDLWISDDGHKNAETFLAGNGVSTSDFVVGINPGSARKSRHWFSDRFALLADRLADRYDARIILTGGPEETPLAEEIAGMMKNKPLVAAGRMTFEETIVLVQRMNLLITTNSSLMHVAAAVGTRFVALIGPGNIVRDRPCQADATNSRLIQKPMPCAPCYRNHCRKKACMEQITVEDVWRSAETLL